MILSHSDWGGLLVRLIDNGLAVQHPPEDAGDYLGQPGISTPGDAQGLPGSTLYCSGAHVVLGMKPMSQAQARHPP